MKVCKLLFIIEFVNLIITVRLHSGPVPVFAIFTEEMCADDALTTVLVLQIAGTPRTRTHI